MSNPKGKSAVEQALSGVTQKVDMVDEATVVDQEMEPGVFKELSTTVIEVGGQQIAVSPSMLALLNQGTASQALSIKKPVVAKIGFDKTHFTLPNGDKKEDINLIIVAVTNVNTWYKGRYDPKNITAPECWAENEVLDDLTHNLSSSNAKVEAGVLCSDCPLNQWESDRAGTKGKDCKESYHLMVVAPNFNKSTEPFLLTIPPTSRPSVEKIFAKFGKNHSAAFKVVATLENCDQYGIVHFKLNGFNERIGEMEDIISQAESLKAYNPQ